MPWTDPTTLITDAGSPLTAELLTALRNNITHANQNGLRITSFTAGTSGGIWTVPADVYMVRATLVGGGQGGGTQDGARGDFVTGSYVVTPGARLSITVGSGGALTTSSASTGVDGGNSSIVHATLGTVTVAGGGGSGTSTASLGTRSTAPLYTLARGVGGNGDNSSSLRGSGVGGLVTLEY